MLRILVCSLKRVKDAISKVRIQYSPGLYSCSPAGQEEFFMAVGVPVDSRTAPPPELDEAAQAAFAAKAQELAPRYRT